MNKITKPRKFSITTIINLNYLVKIRLSHNSKGVKYIVLELFCNLRNTGIKVDFAKRKP